MQFIRQFRRCFPDRRCCRHLDHGTHDCCGFNVQSGHSADNGTADASTDHPRADDGTADASTDYPCADDATASATNATSGANQDDRTPATDS